MCAIFKLLAAPLAGVSDQMIWSSVLVFDALYTHFPTPLYVIGPSALLVAEGAPPALDAVTTQVIMSPTSLTCVT